ncbi:MAG: alpha/beta hydrolase [Bacteroidetes bacterium]|nr:alpha/beta hydrolase [Bacteroidota bacterium]
MVSGSGPQNRNENLLNHEPFLVLSDYLTRNGIVVLRYDDRGVGESKGDFNASTSMDFASDASAAVNYLISRTDIPIRNIGIAGHSEGGLIAPITASENNEVDFIVLMAGPGIPGDSILLLQGDLIAKASGMSEESVKALHELRKNIMQVAKDGNRTMM